MKKACAFFGDDEPLSWLDWLIVEFLIMPARLLSLFGGLLEVKRDV